MKTQKVRFEVVISLFAARELFNCMRGESTAHYYTLAHVMLKRKRNGFSLTDNVFLISIYFPSK
jgi:hypothetical protein